jgi:hypothetical protein
MAMNYLLGRVVVRKGVCRLGIIKNVADWAEMQHGESMKGRFPKDAYFDMSDDFPKDVKLVDVHSNLNNFLVVSERFKDFLAGADALKRNEVYEVGIVNHKGRREKAKYFVIHQFDHLKCADESQCVGVKSRLDPDEYQTLKKLVLDGKKLDASLSLFRVLEYRPMPLFRRDLAAKIEAAELSGIAFEEIESYDDF